jgi:hypothetical protein
MNAPSTTLNCTQCGGELHPDEGQLFLTCPYCSATVFVDKSRVVFHWYVAPTLNDQQASAALYRWMSGSQTVKDLDKKSRLVSQTFRYFPLWYFKWGQETALKPGAATSVSELAHLNLPAGDLKRYDPALDDQSDTPTVPLEAALSWFRQAQPQAAVEEMALVHVPIFICKYEYKNQTFMAVVDAANGNILANIFPAKDETPFRLVAGVTAGLYLCLAVIPLAGAVGTSDGTGMATGLVLTVGVGLVAAPFLIAWAYWVANKV